MLVGLIVGVTLGALETDHAVSKAGRAVVLSTAYQHAATAVAAEESLERKYRLEPGPVPLAGHRAAQLALASALADVRRLGGASDRQLAATLLAQHTRYVLAAHVLFAAVDGHAPLATITEIDNNRVDPTFGLMQAQIYEAAAQHEAEALLQNVALERIDGWVLRLDLATLFVSGVLIAVAGLALRRARRRVRTTSTANRYQALHDGLTRLPNRVLFHDRTEHALAASVRTGEQIAVMLLDLNRFKDVNDTLGHQYGDLLLGQVAERLHTTMRAGDSVARFGGDEFAFLLTGTTRNDALAAAARVTESLQEPFVVHDISLDVDASIGIALAGPNADVETVLRHADVAMYEAKSRHLPFATYELNRDDNTVARLALLGELRRAIGNGELVLYYQPKVNAADGVLHSVEALVRWQHPIRGLLQPGDFIALAENTAVIHPLTEEILRLALMQVRAWLDRGWQISVAVNVSARSLLDLKFATTVERMLETVGVPARLLTFELTESAIMADPTLALSILESLDRLGVGLSIDDYGTGYSSMAYLKALPVRELKIDRSFVMGMTTNENDAVLVQSAVDLGHNLGLHIVAEGVEDATTQTLLTEMGCDLVQGFHIRRPAPAAELDAWLCEEMAGSAPPSTARRSP